MLKFDELPLRFIKNIEKTFGEAGKQYLSSLPVIIESCIKQWKLRDIKIGVNLSYNLIAFANSGEFGKVVLKVGADDKEFKTEAMYARDHKGSATRRALAVDFGLNAMLLEYIDPGFSLDEVANKDEQIKTALDIIQENPQLYSGHDHPYPTYGTWMERTFRLSRSNMLLPKDLDDAFTRAEELYSELITRYPDLYLLHGDLHHENILFEEAGGWKVIDPKGVVDCKYLEIGRFIRNELWRMDDEYGPAASQVMHSLAPMFAFEFDITESVVTTVTYIDAAISNSWNLEGQMANAHFRVEMEKVERELSFLRPLLEI